MACEGFWISEHPLGPHITLSWLFCLHVVSLITVPSEVVMKYTFSDSTLANTTLWGVVEEFRNKKCTLNLPALN
jgi:hypothetical protein